jgi:hypothetical protein
MRSFRPAFALVLLLATPTIARAAWQPGGNPILECVRFEATASGPRVIVAWLGWLGERSYEVRVQAWTADGDVAAGWPADGIRVSGDPPGEVTFPHIVEDGVGGAFVLWTDPAYSDARLQHIAASGDVASPWPVEGIALGPGRPAALAADGDGGVLVARRLPESQTTLQRIDHDGLPAPGWPVEGRQYHGAQVTGLAVDAERHVFMSASGYDTTTASIVSSLRRLDGYGVPDPSWPESGVRLLEARSVARTWLYPDGAGGVFTEWQMDGSCQYPCRYAPNRSAVRVLGDGSTNAGWIPAPKASSFAPDAAGGLVVGLLRDGRPSVLRLDAQGAVVPGWDPQGNLAMSEIVDPPEVLAISDGQGGAYVVWWDSRTGDDTWHSPDYRLYASRLDASGHVAPGWPATGTMLSPRGQSRFLEYYSTVSLVKLGGDVVVAIWREWANGRQAFISALRPGEPGPVADLAPFDREVGFGVVEVRPNPAKGQIVAVVELPVAGPARLDLVDAAGRKLETREFDFVQPARGSVRFNQGLTLPVGIYWLRLTQSGRVATKKLVMLE